MNLRSIRPWAQIVFSLDLMILAAVALIGLIAMPFLWAFDGGLGLLFGFGITTFVALCVFAYAAWIDRDARRSIAEARREHRKARPGPDGDMTDVAGAPDPPPWMGVH
jgi:hypothetical protein